MDDESSRRSNRDHVASGGSLVREYEKIGMTRNVGEDGHTEEEFDFNSEVNLGHQDPIWKEKYKPRKPRFFNRVHTVRRWVQSCDCHVINGTCVKGTCGTPMPRSCLFGHVSVM